MLTRLNIELVQTKPENVKKNNRKHNQKQQISHYQRRL